MSVSSNLPLKGINKINRRFFSEGLKATVMDKQGVKAFFPSLWSRLLF